MKIDHRRGKIYRNIPILAFLAILAAGCSPSRRTTLVIASNGGVLSLDPHTQDEFVTINALSNVYEGLVGYDPYLKIVPLLAVGYDNPASNAWRFHLRPGARFHDGRPVRAQDVVYSLKRARDDPRSIFAGVMSTVMRINAIDSMTVEVRTDRPRPTLINLLAAVAIIPDGFKPGEKAVGTGPYRFVRFLEGNGLVLQRFEGYWGSRPQFAQVEFVYIRPSEARVAALLDGRIDVDAALTPPQRKLLEGQKKVKLVETPLTTVWLLGCDMRASPAENPLSDRRVRRAVSLAIDREELISKAMNGHAKPANQMVPPTIVGYAPDLPPLQRDIEGARRLLRQAGFAEGRELRLALKPRNYEVGRLLEKQLAEAGIRLEADTVAWDSLYRMIEAGAVPFYMMGLAFSFGDASEAVNDLHTYAAGEWGHRNNTGYSNPRLDSLIQSASTEFDPARRMETLQQAMILIADDLPYIPLFFEGSFYAVRPGLQWTPRSDELILAKEFRAVP